jgi:glycosyltransferase involved in cell wall biosynthesis
VKVAVDASGAAHPETGVGRATVGLLLALKRAAPDLDLTLFLNAFRGVDLPPQIRSLGRVVNPHLPARLLQAAWRYLRWPPIETFVGPVDVFYTSDWLHPPQRCGATVSPVLDAGALIHPEWYAPDVVEIHRRRCRDLMERASAITTISHFTRDEFLRLYPAAHGRVHVVPCGVDGSFRPAGAAPVATYRSQRGLPDRFLLYVGTRERRKNTSGLVEVFARVRGRVGSDIGLVVVGMRPWVEGRAVHGVEAWSGRILEQRAVELGIERAIRVLGLVSLPDLVNLYSAAEALVFPSLYEGFGLPALEAMACGLPVVAAARGALPEVVGAAGLLADPEDTDAFAAQVTRLLEDTDLRQSCRARGLERARLFTWDVAGEALLRVLRAVA